MTTQVPTKAAADPKAVVIERARDEHIPVLGAFFEEVWGRDAASGDVRNDPERPSWICLKDGRVIGFLGTFATRVQSGGQEFRGHWLKGFWVLPEYRSGPIGYMLLRHALKDLGAVWSSLVALPARRLMGACGLAERGLLFNRILILRPVQFLRTLDPTRMGLRAVPSWLERMWRILRATPLVLVAGSAATVVLRVRSLPSRVRARDLSTHIGWDVPDADLDALWHDLKNQVTTLTVRDARALRARYREVGGYRLITVRDAGRRLTGWAVLKDAKVSTDVRLAGVRIGSLSDILFPIERPEIGIAAVLGVEQLARRNQADALLCSGTHPALARVLAKCAFVSIPGNLHIMAREDGIDVSETRSEETWFTRGDGQSDGSF